MDQSSSTPTPASSLDEARWFAEQVHPHTAKLRAYLRGAFPTVSDVDDVIQESHMRVCRTHAAQPIRSAKAFLFTVARHLALNLVRRERAAPITAVEDLAKVVAIEESADTREALSRSEKRQLLVEALAALPPRCREVVVLRKLRGIPQKEVAAALNLSERAVEEHVSRGVARCAAYLRKRGIRSFYDA